LIFKETKDKKDIEKCLSVRAVVFIEEQNVPYDLEVDGKDDEALHFLCMSEDNTPMATARVRILKDTAKVERVATLKEHRGKGIGRKLMKFIVESLKNHEEVKKVKLSSQCNAVPFYQKLGFELCNDHVYMDAGIPHQDMAYIYP
jgi:ElaA protein